eukprot:TRINITY_DN44234_c0_g1_i1.p1 TRINITY_DN44234_c0_g1~~TRINITY_DN44234_c0_g1_i1.p1  ORF type:complete len:144 (-),score=27.72 TRINITY_DN44234_c0_g1_i1:377-808(-)
MDSNWQATTGIRCIFALLVLSGLQAAAGCDAVELCRCRMNGRMHGMDGKYLIMDCSSGTPVDNPVKTVNIRQALVDNPQTFQCDSLKLDAYCTKRLGCLSKERQQACERVKPDDCNVDCSFSAPGSVASVAIALCLTAAAIIT